MKIKSKAEFGKSDRVHFWPTGQFFNDSTQKVLLHAYTSINRYVDEVLHLVWTIGVGVQAIFKQSCIANLVIQV